MQVAMMRMEMAVMRVTVHAAIGVRMFMRMGVSVPFDLSFTLAAAANGTHSQTPEITRPTNP
jgi:hypothetical protein